MIGIPIFASDAEDFSGNGLGLLLPSECTVEEVAGGMYSLRLVQPIMDDLRWSLIGNGCIIKAKVPLRESPVYEYTAVSGGTTTTTITRKIYKVRTNGGRLHLRQKPTTSSKILSKWKPGTEVVQLGDEGNGWYHVSVVNGGATGYMYASWLQYDRDVTETITATTPGVNREGVKVQPAREQLFRVNSVETDTDAGTVTATAMHIFYDLRGNIVADEYAPEDVRADDAAAHIFSHALNPHDFTVHAPNLDGKVTGNYGYQSIVEALLDPDEGIVPQANALLVRDNYDVFLLPDQVRDMGVTVRRGKNLIGVTVTHDESDVVTRIVPVGTDKPDKDGNAKPLYLAGPIYVDSTHINDYSTIYAKKIEYDVSVVEKKEDAKPEEGKFATAEEARAELKKRAEAEFEGGCDLPNYGMDVDFILLANTDEYSQYAGLQSVHMFDTVTVNDSLIKLTSKLRVTGYVWDVLTEQYQSVTLGDIQELSQTVYSYNLPTGGISGTKIANGTMSGGVLRDATIGYAKISVAAIETLAANSITALSAHINDLVAGKIEVNQLYADLAAIAVAQITTANIDKANINWAQIVNLSAEVADIIDANIDWANIETLNAKIAEIATAKIEDAKITTAQISDLQAEIANVITLAAQDGKFDFASIKDLLAQAMIIEEGVAGSVYIQNLVATQANILGATLGELVLQGADGNYYNITVQSDGTIRTEQVTVTSGEIAAGQTNGGKQIVATTANVDALNATDIKAQSAIISSIFTGALEAGKISAQEAFLASATIPELRVTALRALGNTLDISANEQIRIIVNNILDISNETDENTNAIATLNKRISSAEQKITSDAIVSTVRSSTLYQSDLSTKADADTLADYAKSSELKQTADGIKLSVTNITNGTTPVPYVKTSHIEVKDNHVAISTGGDFDVDSGGFHVRTGDFDISLVSDGGDNVVMDLNDDGSMTFGNGIHAPNIREAVYGGVFLTQSSIGNLSGLANFLQTTDARFVEYQVQTDQYGPTVDFYWYNGEVSIRGNGHVIPPVRINIGFSGRINISDAIISGPGDYGVIAESGLIKIENCWFGNVFKVGIIATNMAEIRWFNTPDAYHPGITMSDKFATAWWGGNIFYSGYIPGGGVSEGYGHVHAIDTNLTIASGSGTVSNYINSTINGDLGWIGTKHNWATSIAYQGYTTNKGECYACFKFDLPAATSIVSATLTLRRKSGVGKGAPVDIHVYGSATAWGSRPTLGALYALREDAVNAGKTVSIDVTEAIKALRTGSLEQLVLYEGDGNVMNNKVYSTDYCAWDMATLDITYTN